MLLHKIKEVVSNGDKITSEKAMKQEDNKNLSTCGCSAIKNYVADLRGGLNEQLEKDRVLLPTSSPRSAATYELSVLCHKVEEDIINDNVDTNKIKLRCMYQGM
jgi:hypothetical protein